MQFLILTRAGLNDIRVRAMTPGTLVYLNPGQLLPGEVAELQASGAEVRMLPLAVDPDAPEAVQDVIRFIDQQNGNPLWVEHPAKIAGPAAPAPSPDASPGLSSEAIVKPLRHRLIDGAGDLAGRALGYLRNLSRSGESLLIIPYIGYGNAQRITLRGRVLENERFTAQGPDDSRWQNLVELYKRLESDEVVGARVRASFQGVEQEAVTDQGGYFSFEIEHPTPLSATGWLPLELELISPKPAGQTPLRASAKVLVPPPTARFGVISDIDDTILWTNVTNRLNMMLMMARSNAHTRKPFKGVAAFYRALHEGMGGENNPIFYVSSSPWHLFAPLVEFMQVQDIPLGPLMLKELALRKVLGQERHRGHKLDKIENILRFYPHLQFILIGDSGEHDPEIYAEVVKRHPKAIRIIYIRNVNPDPSRIDAIDRLIAEVRLTGTQLILAPDSEYAAAHAAAEGLIPAAGMAAVRSDKEEDEVTANDGSDAGQPDQPDQG